MPLECRSILKSASAIVFLMLVRSPEAWALVPDDSAATNVVAIEPARPLVPTYVVQRFEVAGSAVLEQTAIDRAMSGATGTNISVLQIRRALGKLQQAYRDRGYLKAALRLPQQSLTNGTVRVEVTLEPSAPAVAAPLPAWRVPLYDVEHFKIRGNTALSPEQIDQILGPVAGPSVDAVQLQKALSQLQTAYRERGLIDAAVTLPQQVLTDGRVVIQVDEGTLPIAKSESDGATNAPAPPALKFVVREYEVAGNTLLSPAVLNQAFTNAVGDEVGFEQIQKALGALQLAYRERGYAAVSVALPQQQLTNAVIKVQVTEGRLVDVRVTDNRYFSSNNILKSLPVVGETTKWGDGQLNSFVFQRELDIANQNRDRQIYPTLRPGPEPGTTALTLKVKDRLPLHGRVDLNNQSTPGTPDWRINTSLNYANLWQLEHQAGLSYGFTPEEYKSGDQIPDYLLNRPLVANYGAFYRIPFGEAQTITETINNSTQFGYNEATHQFVLPPAGSRPDFTLFGSVASTDTGAQFGPSTLVSQTPLLTIFSRDSGQNFTINDGIGARFNIPRALSDTSRLNFSFGPDWKRYYIKSLNTNNFLIRTVITNAQGSQVFDSTVSSPQPERESEVTYLPLSFGVDYSSTDPHGSFAASLGLSGNFAGQKSGFSGLAYSPDADVEYGKVTLSLTRDQKVFKDWSLLLRANGQVASGPLLSNEQYALGGLNSVRGYYEGEAYGDAGWFSSAELRTPYINGRVPAWSKFVPVWLRGSTFIDYGQIYRYEPDLKNLSLMGVGVGVSANINNHIDVRLTLGWPLLDGPSTTGREPRASFSIGGQF